MITEAEVREASGDELNKLVALYIENDNLGCFDGKGNERRKRIFDCIADASCWMGEIGGVCGFELNGKKHPSGEIDCILSYWDSRHGKPYQSDLEAHVCNWRAKARDFEGDANLAMTLWCDTNGPFGCEDDRMFSLQRTVEDTHFELVHFVQEFVWIDGWHSVRGYPESIEPAQAICRAAVILESESEVRSE